MPNTPRIGFNNKCRSRHDAQNQRKFRFLYCMFKGISLKKRKKDNELRLL